MDARRSPAIWLLPAVIVGLSALIFSVVFGGSGPAIHITAINHGPLTLSMLAVHVKGQVRTIGDLAPGQSARRQALPTDETGVAVEYTDATGKRVRLNVDGTFKPTDRGEVIVELRDGKIATFQFN